MFSMAVIYGFKVWEGRNIGDGWNSALDDKTMEWNTRDGRDIRDGGIGWTGFFKWSGFIEWAGFKGWMR